MNVSHVTGDENVLFRLLCVGACGFSVKHECFVSRDNETRAISLLSISVVQKTACTAHQKSKEQHLVGHVSFLTSPSVFDGVCRQTLKKTRFSAI